MDSCSVMSKMMEEELVLTAVGNLMVFGEEMKGNQLPGKPGLGQLTPSAQTGGGGPHRDINPPC